MRIAYFGNNRLGLQILKWLRERNENVVALIVHPPEKQRLTKEIIEISGLPEDRVFCGNRLREKTVADAIRASHPDIGLSILFGYILHESVLSLFSQGCINLHPAYLPYNRGAHPNVWSIIEGTPAGATLHYMDTRIDTGAIIAQSKVQVEPVDTGVSLYEKLEAAALRLFCETWPIIKSQRVESRGQRTEAGSYHYVKDLQAIDEINLDQLYTGRQLIDMLRARTFPPHPGCYFKHNGRKVYVSTQLSYEEQARSGERDA